MRVRSDANRDKTGRLSRLLSNRRWLLTGVCLLLGLCLLLVPSGERTADGSSDAASDMRAVEHALAAELEELLSSVEGVGRCRVMLTLASYGTSEYRSGRTEATIPPRVEAVTVVCEGAGSAAVRATLCDVLTSLFSIGAHRITVLPMKN